MSSDPTLSDLVRAAESGAAPSDALFTALYKELHRMARRELSRRGAGVTLSPTTLLHEAYLDISKREPSFPDRNRFMAYAARVMRGLIIDYARSRQAQKRGGLFEITAIKTDAVAAAPDTAELERINEAQEALVAIDPQLALIVDLKFFCGYSFAEIAAMQGVSERTVQRDWQKARMFLHRTLRTSDATEP